ncbi:MAG: type II secretion system F family protein [bacterium]
MEFLFFIMSSASAAYALSFALAGALRRRRLRQAIEDALPAKEPLHLRAAYWLGVRSEQLAARFNASLKLKSVERRLTAAGLDPALAPGFAAMQAIAATSCALVAASLAGTHRAAGAICGALLGWFWLWSAIAGRARKRRESIERSFPFALDMLTLCVEAGSDFGQAIARVAARLRGGPLAAEFKRLDASIRMGSSRREALLEMGRRIDMPSVSAFTSLTVQADRLGTGIGPVLRAASSRMRAMRLVRAERRGAAAATKILFPLIACIMPAAFIVIFGPIIVKVAMGGVGALL